MCEANYDKRSPRLVARAAFKFRQCWDNWRTNDLNTGHWSVLPTATERLFIFKLNLNTNHLLASTSGSWASYSIFEACLSVSPICIWFVDRVSIPSCMPFRSFPPRKPDSVSIGLKNGLKSGYNTNLKYVNLLTLGPP